MHRLVSFVPLLLIASSPALAAGASAADLPYPETIPGRHAREYFVAYNAGEDAMRAYWTAHASPAALAQRPVDARVGVWRQMHDEHGALTPLRVQASGDDFVEIVAAAEHGAPISIRFLCEADAAHGLVALRVEDAEDAAPGGAAPPPPVAVVDSGPAPTDAEIVAAASAELDSLARIGEFSGAALLDKGGRTLFAHAYGMASREQHVPNEIDTRFNLASINKIFTHVAIEQLAQQGKLRLDDTIDHYLPDYPAENGKRITVHMLLEHRGGVADVLQSVDLSRDPSKVRTMAAWYALIRDQPLRFEPGTKQQYSNGGFVLLGQIITKVSGEDYYDYVRRHIYAPAGMTRTDHDAIDERVKGRATGYTRDTDAAGVPNTGMMPGRGSAAGGGYSTVGDMVRFARALRAGKLLDAAHVRDVFGEKFTLGIAGGSPGVNGLFLVRGPYTLVILSNIDPPAAERFVQTIGRMVRRAGGV